MDNYEKNARLVEEAVEQKCAFLQPDPLLAEHVLNAADEKGEMRDKKVSPFSLIFALVMMTMIAVTVSLIHRRETLPLIVTASLPDDEWPGLTDVSTGNPMPRASALSAADDTFLVLSQFDLPSWSDCCATEQGILIYHSSRIFIWDGTDASVAPIEVPPSLSFERLFSNEHGIFALSRQGTLYTVQVEENHAAFDEIAQVPLELDGEQIDKAMLSDASLFILTSDPFDMAEVPARSLLEYDLTTGACRQRLTAQPILDAACGRAGELFLLTKPVDKQACVEMLILDRNERTIVAELPGSSAAGIAYQADTDTMYAASAGNVYRIEKGKQPAPCAYLPESVFRNTSYAVLTADGRYALHHNDAVYLRYLSDDFALQKPLMIANVTFDYYGRDGFRAFQQECAYPAAYSSAHYASAEEYLRDFLFGNAADVYGVNDPNVFSALMDKGYCVDLSGSEAISAYVERMYPSISGAFCRDGKIYAIPFITGFDFRFVPGYNPQVLEMIGLTEADLPRTFMEWMTFLEEWADSPVLEENDLDLVRASIYGDLRELLLTAILDQQAIYCDQNDLPPTFKDETLTALLNKLDEITPLLQDLDASSRQNAQYRAWDDTGSALFIIDYRLFTGDGESIMNGGCNLWGFGLDRDIPMYYPLRLTLLFVNAQTENRDMAVALLEHLLADLDDASRLSLFPDENESVENEYYPDYLAQYEQEMQLLERLLAQCDDPSEREGLIESMDSVTAKWAETLSNRYAISPRSIAEYRGIGEQVVPYSDLIHVIRSTENLQNAYNRYLAGQISTTEFIDTLERVLRYIQSEDQSSR